MHTTPAITLDGVSKTYGSGPRTVHALRGVSTAIPTGAFCTIMGPSGSGKSTLLHLCGGLETPSAGVVTVAGKNLAALSERELARFRRETVGFVFQFFNLLPTLTAAENLALPLLLAGERLRQHKARIAATLSRLGLGDRGHHLPEQLSGGELQRVALGRALITRPAVLLADEPTGNLDSESGREILELLVALTQDREATTTVVIVTHDPQAARYGDHHLTLRDGALTESTHPGSAEDGVRRRITSRLAPSGLSPSG